MTDSLNAEAKIHETKLRGKKIEQMEIFTMLKTIYERTKMHEETNGN